MRHAPRDELSEHLWNDKTRILNASSVALVSRRSYESRSMKQTNPDIVSASDVSSWAYCPESWRLSELGHEPANQLSLTRGESHHDEARWAEQSTRRSIRLGTVLLVIAAVLLAASLIAGTFR